MISWADVCDLLILRCLQCLLGFYPQRLLTFLYLCVTIFFCYFQVLGTIFTCVSHNCRNICYKYMLSITANIIFPSCGSSVNSNQLQLQKWKEIFSRRNEHRNFLLCFFFSSHHQLLFWSFLSPAFEVHLDVADETPSLLPSFLVNITGHVSCLDVH